MVIYYYYMCHQNNILLIPFIRYLYTVHVASISFKTIIATADKGNKLTHYMSKPYINVMPTTWWRHLMETFPALLAFCAGNSPVPGEFPTQMPVTRSFDVFFDLRLNKRLSKQPWGWWFETLSWPLWRQCNVWLLPCVNSSLPGQNGRHFEDDIFRCIFVNQRICVLIIILRKFVFLRVQLPEPMMTQFSDAYMRHWMRWVKWVRQNLKCSVRIFIWNKFVDKLRYVLWNNHMMSTAFRKHDRKVIRRDTATFHIPSTVLLHVMQYMLVSLSFYIILYGAIWSRKYLSCSAFLNYCTLVVSVKPRLCQRLLPGFYTCTL